MSSSTRQRAYKPAADSPGQPVAWTQDDQDRTGLVWGPGDLTRSLWAVPDSPREGEVAVLLRRTSKQPDLTVVQTETARSLATRLRRTNALAAPGATVTVTWSEDSLAPTRPGSSPFRVRRHTVHLTGCDTLPMLAEQADRSRADTNAVSHARRTARTPKQRETAWALPVPHASGAAEPTPAYPYALLSRDGQPPASTGDWCPYCLAEAGLVDGARAVLAHA